MFGPTQFVFIAKKLNHGLRALAIVTTFGILSMPASAQSVDTSTPDGLVKYIVNDVMTSVKADKEIQAGNIPKIMNLVDQKIVPYTDLQKTTQMAMGRNWNKATPEQQKAITTEFKSLLVRTYSGAISQIRDQTVIYKPFRAAAEDTEVIVRTQVINKGDPIQLDYRLMKVNNGWKVYDINVLGAWLIEAYRNQFNNQISQNGIDGLIKFLQDRNRTLASAK
jgi:phospholipid transport system substrate-binding protein